MSFYIKVTILWYILPLNTDINRGVRPSFVIGSTCDPNLSSVSIASSLPEPKNDIYDTCVCIAGRQHQPDSNFNYEMDNEIILLHTRERAKK